MSRYLVAFKVEEIILSRCFVYKWIESLFILFHKIPLCKLVRQSPHEIKRKKTKRKQDYYQPEREKERERGESVKVFKNNLTHAKEGDEEEDGEERTVGGRETAKQDQHLK